MESHDRFGLMWVCSGISVIAVVLFWNVWFYVSGSVPSISEIRLWGDNTVTLPFSVSRYWDIAIAPVITSLFLLVLTNKSVMTSKDARKGMTIGLIYGLIIGLFSVWIGSFAGLGVVLAFGVSSGLVSGLAFGTSSEHYGKLVNWRDFGLAFGLAYGFLCGLIFGLVFGLVFGLFFGLLINLAFALSYFLVQGTGRACHYLKNR
jgi:hypothetical protein